MAHVVYAVPIIHFSKQVRMFFGDVLVAPMG